MNHGPFLVDNNLFLSGVSLLDMSEGGAYVHNLLTGKIISRPELEPRHALPSGALDGRRRPGQHQGRRQSFLQQHPGRRRRVLGRPGKPAGKDPQRAAGFGLWVYDAREFPLQTGGNVYYNGARPYAKEAKPVVQAGIRSQGEGRGRRASSVYLHLTLGQAVQKVEPPRS